MNPTDQELVKRARACWSMSAVTDLKLYNELATRIEELSAIADLSPPQGDSDVTSTQGIFTDDFAGPFSKKLSDPSVLFGVRADSTEHLGQVTSPPGANIITFEAKPVEGQIISKEHGVYLDKVDEMFTPASQDDSKPVADSIDECIKELEEKLPMDITLTSFYMLDKPRRYRCETAAWHGEGEPTFPDPLSAMRAAVEKITK